MQSLCLEKGTIQEIDAPHDFRPLPRLPETHENNPCRSCSQLHHPPPQTMPGYLHHFFRHPFPPRHQHAGDVISAQASCFSEAELRNLDFSYGLERTGKARMDTRT